MLRAVIFDLDGTLYDNGSLQWRIPLSNLRHLRYLWRERSLRKLMRGRAHENEQDFYQHFFRSISHRHPEKVSQWYHEQYLPGQVEIIRHHCQLDAWVKPRLTELHEKGLKIAVYSDYGHVCEKLQALGIDPSMFDVVADAPALGGLKPCEQSMRRLLDMLGVSANEAMIVGDRLETDIASAQKVGAQYRLLRRKGKNVSFINNIA